MAKATLKRALDWESMNQRPTKRRCFNSFISPSRNRDGPRTSALPRNRFAEDCNEPSPFSEAALAKMTSDKMTENLYMEIKRLYKPKQLPNTSNALERMQESESSGSDIGADSPPHLMLRPRVEKELFTFNQVQLIRENMIKERENQLRPRYESELTGKLGEQYDAFVKFTYDQIQRRYVAAPSYLS